MRVLHFDYRQVPGIAEKDLAYLCDDPRLQPFCLHPQQMDAFEQLIEQRCAHPCDRALLVSVLRDQYASLPENEAVHQAIEALGKNRTFTVVTAHQPSLFTGPLYFIYKIVSAINLARTLGRRFPDKTFVPVFVIGGEDHDFEEINHAWVFGRRIEWQTEAGGPVGRLSTESLRPALDQLREVLGDRPEATRWYALIEEAYTRYPRYVQATQALVHGLFGKYGLVALQMDEPRLKAAFRSVIRREVLEQVSHPVVTATQQALAAQGFEPQAYVRPINFFYMTDTSRERIEPEGDGFRLVDSGRFLAKAEMEAEIEQHPERFSPNVVMRPIYQEFILPNLAYVGGGGEIAYWLERKDQFALFGLPYPMLVRRNSALWIDRSSARRMDKLGLTVEDLFTDTEALIKQWLARHADEPFSLDAERRELEALFARVAEKARAIDPTMEKKVLAEGARQLKALEGIETRLVRAEKQKHEQAINQIRKLRDKLFPGGKLQERHDNFLSIATRIGDTFFETVFAHLDPMDRRFVVFVEG